MPDYFYVVEIHSGLDKKMLGPFILPDEAMTFLEEKGFVYDATHGWKNRERTYLSAEIHTVAPKNIVF